MNQQSQANNNKWLLMKLSLGVIFMFGFAYMLVPLYSLVCKQWGINGKANSAVVAAPKDLTVDEGRTIEVGFSTTVHGGMAFIFKPLERKVHIHPGETKLKKRICLSIFMWILNYLKTLKNLPYPILYLMLPSIRKKDLILLKDGFTYDWGETGKS